jgi:hypothetical protein
MKMVMGTAVFLHLYCEGWAVKAVSLSIDAPNESRWKNAMLPNMLTHKSRNERKSVVIAEILKKYLYVKCCDLT